jgi:hypothetical protein
MSPVPRPALAAVAALLALAVAGGAQAKVPKFKTKTIVPGQAIGGLKVGMTKAKAVKTWGKPEHCQDSPLWCQFRADSHINGFTTNNPFAGWYVKSGKIVAIEIEFAENDAIDPKLMKLKTSKGIHLGSSMADARSKYGLGAGSGGEAGLSRAIVKKGNRCTLFYAPEAPYTKIDAIQVGVCGAAGLV